MTELLMRRGSEADTRLDLRVDRWRAYAANAKVDVAFCDGGLVGANGTAKTGISAYCFGHVNPTANWRSLPPEDIAIHLTKPELHVFTSEFLLRYCVDTDFGCDDRVTNNQSEFFALMMLMANLPAGWGGAVVCDSQITIGRASLSRLQKPIEGLPYHWRIYMLEQMERVGRVKYLQVDGHQEESKLWFHVGNCHVDRACTEASKRIKAWTKEWKEE